MSYVSTLRIDLQKPSRCGGASPSDGRRERCAPLLENAPQESQRHRPEHPAFSRPLCDSSVQEGSDLILEGQVTGTPPLSVSWLHNGEPLLFGKTYFQAGVARLVVDECLPEDAGVYTCVLANCAGKTSSTAAVTVKDMGRIDQSKASQVSQVMVSSRVTSVSSSSMVSRVSIAPNGTAELEKGAVTMFIKVLPQNEITREMRKTGPLGSVLDSHTLEKESTCHALRPGMTLKASNGVTQKAENLLDPPATVQPQADINDAIPAKGTTVCIPSSCISGSGSRRERTHNAAHTDGSPAAHNHVTLKEIDFSAPLAAVQAPDCSKIGISSIARHAGQAKKQHILRLEMPVKVNECPDEMASRILAPLADALPEDCIEAGVSEKDLPGSNPSSPSLTPDRELTCSALPSVIVPVGIDGPSETEKCPPPAPVKACTADNAIPATADNDPVFLLSPASSCATPDHVTPKRRALKSAGDTLRLVDPINCVEVKVGDRAELYCEIVGSPPIAASWVRQKKPISSGTKTSVETTNAGSKLVIRDVQADDSGCYTLFVQDRTGSIQHQISLSVADRPQPPSGKPYVSALQAETLTLSWSGPCYDGGSAIQYYVVEVKKVGEKTWRMLTDSCLSTSYRVKGGLEPQQEYQFRVLAVNAHGTSEPGDESTIIKMSTEEDASITEPFEYQQVVINTSDKVSDLYTQLEKLGVGKFGQVYKLQEKSSGRILAGKFYKTRVAKEKENARMEVELMNKLHHPKLVQCVAAYQTRSEMVMVLEYIAGGELFERIIDDSFEFTEPTCVQYVCQILEGVQYMHRQNIVHLDLKPENIVCVNRTGTSIKIIDFGLARMLGLGNQVKVMQGTPEFVAPEVIAFEAIGFTTDMWSIGVVCYILLSGDSPFQGNTDMETLHNVTAAQWEFDEETFEEISDRAKDFISKLLVKNMRSRLTTDKALEHPWLQEMGQGSTKMLSKEKLKKFLARQKWQKTGKAVLALKRMSLLTNKHDNKVISPDSPQTTDSEVFSFLNQQIQRPPSFSTPMNDQVEVEGSSACLKCQIEGYPDPEVIWFQNGIPVQESDRFRIDYDETGNCSLIVSGVTQGDSGLYTCKAFNSMGEVEVSAKLTVSSLHGARNR